MTLDTKFIGKEYPEITYEIGKEKHAEFVKAVKADPSLYSEYIHPTFPVVYAAEQLNNVLFDEELKLNLDRLVHGEQEFIYHKPVYIGDTIKAKASIEKIFQKGPHDFVAFKVSSFDKTGELVVESNSIFVVRGGNDAKPSLQEKIMLKLASLIPSKELPVDNSIKPLEFEAIDDGYIMNAFIDKYMPQKYAGASSDFNAIHLDNKLGKSVGLGGYILHGMATMALGANYITHKVKPQELKSYKVRFSAPVKPGDHLLYSGDIEDGLFKFTAVNQKRQEVLGSAKAEF